MDEVQVAGKPDLIDMTADIVSAYVGHNTIAPEELSGLINRVYAALNSAAGGVAGGGTAAAEPAVPVRKSITPDYLICLEDGKKFKSLKRHLRSHYNLSPEEYREKWGLPRDYPMVAPNYAQARSRLAKKMGLGQGGQKKRRGSPK
ncbi:MucR family transcriptional regulator [Parvibaculum sp.]|jgi:predicted transcriptional regulator|uniref:MucR family transcriptional regulator n=1 Tax=Parvibaculum sp. TaxID=2024848 RepID=UPI000C5CBE13|nr:MucR family transcriptional regulator [Parvibaculum sp.]HAC60103.1 MucR family transcriptional regulator [Rhodobiaceae bacterium]MAU62235.1 MucR family transcriptional regulator [Parvibaculum sp.]MBO6667127.1 MucR family transcriptional regulator [Parvibaculum sp.]MBO6692265.1 MucR family transcriptional regulator [Parvibaculum sp.]MBO6713680.1 MucR family transcriptional regulator [Parvibaculum sp.]|tara:strand:- start:2927 stop:3364 length:438 start_codon:yes stop_codon:yes gene_type:complete